MTRYETITEQYYIEVFVNSVQDASGGFTDCSCVDVEEICALSAEETAGAGAGGAAGDAAYHAASPRPPGHHATLLRLSL